MARLNTRVSRQRSSSPMSTGAISSDQENHDPVSRRMDKGKQRAVDVSPPAPSLPTPASQDSDDGCGQKRKRAATPSRVGGEVEDIDPPDTVRKFKKYYDPNQNLDERREIKRNFRELQRDVQESRDDFMRESDGKGVRSAIIRANVIFKNVKQTNDATIDSRLLVHISETVSKKSAQLVLGDTSTGIDVDEFLSKCITYMRNGGPLDGDEDAAHTATQSRRRNRDDSNEDDEDGGGILDWELLGRHACYPCNSRPAVRSFLLGPLSVEKKQRKETQRRARNARDAAGREVRPEELTRESLQQSDERGLTAICAKLHKRLKRLSVDVEETLQAEGITSEEELRGAEGQEILDRFNYTNAGGVSLFHFVINPRSFGQTIENMFYVSFLIKEGHVGLQTDDEGRAGIVLVAEDEGRGAGKRRSDAKKHQAVFSLDYATWQELIEAFEITEPMIPHREEDDAAQQVGQSGWYN